MRINSLNVAKACVLLLCASNKAVDRKAAVLAFCAVTKAFNLDQRDDDSVFEYILYHTKQLPIV